MVYIPPGIFIMGESGAGAVVRFIEDVLGERGQLRDDRYRRQVRMAGFYLDRYEVSNVQYLAFVKAIGHAPPAFWDGDGAPSPAIERYPVVGVGLQEAQDYCTWAGKRLPTEEEWEKAARGEQGFRYPWGDFYEKGRANTWEEGKRGSRSVYEYTGDVSPYGTYGMAGNVMEWTATLVEIDNGEVRAVIKGGSWAVDGSEWIMSMQVLGHSSGRSNEIGFRCAKSAVEDQKTTSNESE